MTGILKPIVAAAVLLAGAAFAARAQPTVAQLAGRVTDPTGSGIPGAVVTASNVDQASTRHAVTSIEGYYVLALLPPGLYRLEAQAEGFRPVVQSGLRLHAGQKTRVDVLLRLGVVVEVVTIESGAMLLHSEGPELAQLHTERAVKELPVNGRNFARLTALAVGVMPAQTQMHGSPLTMKRGVTGYSFNGARLEENRFLADGIDLAENHNGLGVLLFPSLDAIEEFRIETSLSDVRVGRGGGGTISVTYKSGSQEFHGGLYEYLRHDRLDAKNFFDSPEAKIPPFKQNQYGAYLGGPLKSKGAPKTFFFVNFEGSRVRQSQTFISSVPTEAFRRGDFSQSRFAIFDPASDRRAASGALLRDPFSDRSIPASRIDPVGGNLLGVYPLPNLPGEADNFLYHPLRTIDSEKFDVKIDRTLAGGATAFLRYTHNDDDLIEPSYLPSPAVGNGPGVPGPTDQPVRQVVLSETHTLSRAAVNQFRAGWTRLSLRSFNPNYGRNVSEQLGVPGANVPGDPLTSGLSIFHIANFRALGGNGFSPAVIVSDNFQLGDTVSWVRGRHSLIAGGELRRLRYNAFQSSLLRGQMRFGRAFTRHPDAAAAAESGHGGADVLLGKPLAGEIRFLNGTRGFRRTELAAYLQDAITLNSRTTLTLGLRYDNFLGWPWTEVNNRMYNFLPDRGTVFRAGSGPVPWRSGHPGDHSNFSPRLGLARRFGQRTVVRAGYGLFFAAPQLDGTRNLGANPPEFITSSFDNDEFQFAAARSASQGFERPPLGAIQGSLRAIDLTARTPYTQQWNTAIQRLLPGQTSLTVAYAGTKGTALQGHTNINQAFPGLGAVASRRTFPQFGEIRSLQTRYDSVHHALQASLERRFTGGLGVVASYTWAKTVSNLDAQFQTPIDIRDLGRDRALTGFSAPRRFAAAFLYELPFQPPGFWKHWAGGWQFNGVVSLYDGLPFSVLSPNTTNCCRSYADRLRDGRLAAAEQSIDRWFDMAAFAPPGPQQFGNAGRNILFGPGTRNLDFSVIKDLHRSADGSRRLQLRAEFFNLTNTPQFNNPNADIGSAGAGRVRSAGSPITLQRIPRQVQLGLKYSF